MPTLSTAPVDADLAVDWTPVNVTADDALDINYLDITNTLTTRVNPEEERLHFWDDLYAKYNDNLI